MNLANKITLGRILFIPIIIVLLYLVDDIEGQAPNMGDKVFCLIATICLVFACLSDIVDGWVARREKQVTRFGKFLDPLADKLLVCSILIMLTRLAWIPAWVVIIIIGRELLVTGLRAMAADQGVVIAADKYGKIKTILQSIALVFLTLHYEWFGLNPEPIGQALLYIALVVTVFSGVNYLKVFHVHWLEGAVASNVGEKAGASPVADKNSSKESGAE